MLQKKILRLTSILAITFYVKVTGEYHSSCQAHKHRGLHCDASDTLHAGIPCQESNPGFAVGCRKYYHQVTWNPRGRGSGLGKWDVGSGEVGIGGAE